MGKLQDGWGRYKMDGEDTNTGLVYQNELLDWILILLFAYFSGQGTGFPINIVVHSLPYAEHPLCRVHVKHNLFKTIM